MEGLWPQNAADSAYSPKMRERFDPGSGDIAIDRVIAELGKFSDQGRAQPASEQAQAVLEESDPQTRLGLMHRLVELVPQDAITAAALAKKALAAEATSHVVAMLGLGVKPPYDVARLVREIELPPPARNADGKLSAIKSLAGIERCSNLELIDLSGNPISSLEPLSGLPVRVLNASNTKVRDLSPILKMSKLSSLAMTGSKVSDLRPLEQLMRTRDPDLGAFVHDTSGRDTFSGKILGLPLTTWAALALGFGMTGCEVQFGALSGSLASIEGALAKVDIGFGVQAGEQPAETARTADSHGRAVDFFVVSHGLRWKLGSSDTVVDGAGREMPVDDALRDFVARSGEAARQSDEVIALGLSSQEGESLETERVRAIMRSESIARAILPQIGDRRLWTLSLGRHWGNRSAVTALSSADQRPLIVVFARRRDANADVSDALSNLVNGRFSASADLPMPLRGDYSDFCLAEAANAQ